MGQNSRLPSSLRSLCFSITVCVSFFLALYALGEPLLQAFLIAGGFWLMHFAIVRGLFKIAAADPKGPQSIATVPSDIHAAPIVEALQDAGIRATAVGGYTAGFRAEAPGQVHVVVAREDVERARQVLAEIRAEDASLSS